MLLEQQVVALEQADAQTQHPDLILVDTPMPKLDRGTLLQTTQQDSRQFQPPIITLTAPKAAAADYPEVEMDSDCSIAKPLNFKQLTATIQALLENRKVENRKGN